MLRVACKDMGVAGCDFVAEGEKVHKVEAEMLEHLREEHPSMVAGLTDVQHRELEIRIKSEMHSLEPGALPHEIDKHAPLRISCADFGTPDCEFVAEDRKVRKVEHRFFDHLRDRHPEIIAGLSVDGYRELEHRVKATIAHE